MLRNEKKNLRINIDLKKYVKNREYLKGSRVTTATAHLKCQEHC